VDIIITARERFAVFRSVTFVSNVLCPRRLQRVRLLPSPLLRTCIVPVRFSVSLYRYYRATPSRYLLRTPGESASAIRHKYMLGNRIYYATVSANVYSDRRFLCVVLARTERMFVRLSPIISVLSDTKRRCRIFAKKLSADFELPPPPPMVGTAAFCVRVTRRVTESRIGFRLSTIRRAYYGQYKYGILYTSSF